MKCSGMNVYCMTVFARGVWYDIFNEYPADNITRLVPSKQVSPLSFAHSHSCNTSLLITFTLFTLVLE